VITPFIIPVWLPLILAVAVPFAALTFLGRDSALARAIAALVCVLCALRYEWWRWTSPLPAGQEIWQQAWAWIFLIFESATLAGITSSYVFMSRTRNRSKEVDARAGSPMLAAAVDVFIATYNEDAVILERTIVGATSIDHPDMRVWVLDDGARPWVRNLANELGAFYRQRVRGEHAKAGNVNNGLREALATGRRPEFILLLDADFVAARHILKRTLPLFEETDVGIVQTPQHFFNPDPLQANMLCSSVWPDEQRFFFNYLQPSKDAWGAAFCCGTSAVLRVAALQQCGGIPTATVTEDMLTTFRMHEDGYRTIYLNERLSLGLAPEGLSEYVTQRSRWCLGTIQQIRTRWGFAGRARIGLMNRVSALEGTLYWSASYVFKVMVILSPMIFWWTGTVVIEAGTDDILAFLCPFLASGLVFNGFLAGNAILPVMTDVTHLLSAPAVIGTVAKGLVKPWGHAFKVTSKGVSSEHVTVQWRILAPFAVMAIATVAGMLVNLSPFGPRGGTPNFAVNVVWSMFSILVLAVACAVCVELPKRRGDERFTSGEAGVLVVLGEAASACTVRDISVGGARLDRDGGWDKAAPAGELVLDRGMFRLPYIAMRISRDGSLAIRFRLADASRRALIRKLFTGGYDNEVERVDVLHTFIGALRTVFR
jgi:cellulose synthase (UDP-forming)